LGSTMPANASRIVGFQNECQTPEASVAHFQENQPGSREGAPCHRGPDQGIATLSPPLAAVTSAARSSARPSRPDERNRRGITVGRRRASAAALCPCAACPHRAFCLLTEHRGIVVGREPPPPRASQCQRAGPRGGSSSSPPPARGDSRCARSSGTVQGAPLADRCRAPRDPYGCRS